MMLLMPRFIFLEATPWWSVLAEHPKRGPTPTQIWLWNLERKKKGFHSLCVWQRHPWKRSRRWLFIWELKHLTLIHLRLPLVFPSAPSSSLSPPLLFFFFDLLLLLLPVTFPSQLPERFGQNIPGHLHPNSTGRPEDSCQNHGHRGDALHVQGSALQVRICLWCNCCVRLCVFIWFPSCYWLIRPLPAPRGPSLWEMSLMHVQLYVRVKVSAMTQLWSSTENHRAISVGTMLCDDAVEDNYWSGWCCFPLKFMFTHSSLFHTIIMTQQCDVFFNLMLKKNSKL